MMTSFLKSRACDAMVSYATCGQVQCFAALETMYVASFEASETFCRMLGIILNFVSNDNESAYLAPSAYVQGGVPAK